MSLTLHKTKYNFTDLTEKLRVYLKDVIDTNQMFAAHVGELTRNEYIDYSAS